LSELPRIIQALRRRHPRNNFRRRRFCILLIEPRLHLAGGALDLGRRQAGGIIHGRRRGYHVRVSDCGSLDGMYGDDFVAPSAAPLGKMPGGIS